MLSPPRFVEVIRDCAPDIVALQELDVGHARSGHAEQPDLLSKALGMKYHFQPAMGAANEHYGDAILSRLPLR